MKIYMRKCKLREFATFFILLFCFLIIVLDVLVCSKIYTKVTRARQCQCFLKIIKKSVTWIILYWGYAEKARAWQKAKIPRAWTTGDTGS